MPDLDDEVQRHLRRWGEHRASAERLFALDPPELAWGLVATSYASLHLVQAYLQTKGERFQADNPGARWRALRAAPELRALWNPYNQLRAMSEEVRYAQLFEATPDDRDTALGALQRVESVLRP